MKFEFDDTSLHLFNQTGPGSYHNTNRLTGDTLKERTEQAGSQERIVLQFFIQTYPHKFTASQVTDALHRQGHKFIKDSVKRSMSNLAANFRRKPDGTRESKVPHLRRTNERIPGPYGHSESLYELMKSTI